MSQPITATRPGPATTAVDTGRADSLFRLAAAWRACPKSDASASAGPLFGQIGRETAVEHARGDRLQRPVTVRASRR